MWSSHYLSFRNDEQLQWVDVLSATRLQCGWFRWLGWCVMKHAFLRENYLSQRVDSLRLQRAMDLSRYCLPVLSNAFPFWYKRDLWGSQSDHKGKQISAHTKRICIFGGLSFSTDPLTLLNNTPQFGLTCIQKGRWLANYEVGNNSEASESSEEAEDVMPINYRSTSRPLHRLKTDMRLMCVGSVQVSVNIGFSQTHCHEQKKRNYWSIKALTQAALCISPE